jgi:hypothetical protein
MYRSYPQEHTEHTPVTACGIIIMTAISPIELKIYNAYIGEQISKLYKGNNITRKNECTP